MSNGTQVYWGNVATDTTGLLPKSGGTMTGTLTLKDIMGTNGTAGTYGTTLPTNLNNDDNGRIFFQISEPYYEIPAGGTAGQALIKEGNANERRYTWGDVASSVNAIAETQHSLYVCGVYREMAQDGKLHYNPTVYISNNGVLQGAAWNDYAEYRVSKEHRTGRCVQEQDNGELIITDKRLIPGASIISDTYGFIEGRTETATTPIAVAGRVLAYPYRSRTEYHAGMCVCSAPNGTIDIMTREEIKEYPDCIVGIVSEIPQYEKWGSGNVSVDGRIWVKVK